MADFSVEQIRRHLGELSDDYENVVKQSGKQDDWMFAACAPEYVRQLLTLQDRLEELINWIDERKFEQTHKYCGCTYCRARLAIGKQP